MPRPVTVNQGLEHTLGIFGVRAAGRIDQAAEPAAQADERSVSRPATGLGADNPKFLGPHPGTAVDALEGHVAAIIEPSRIVEIAQRTDFGGKRHPVAQFQIGFAHDGQANLPVRCVGLALTGKDFDVQYRAGAAEAKNGRFEHASLNLPPAAVQVMDDVVRSVIRRNPRHHGEVTGGQNGQQGPPPSRAIASQRDDGRRNSGNQHAQKKGGKARQSVADEDAGDQGQGHWDGRPVINTAGRVRIVGNHRSSNP